MGDGEWGKLLQGVVPAGLGLFGKFEHQVDRYIGDAGCVGGFDGLDGSMGVVGAAEKGQFIVIERLDAEADAVDAD